MQTKKEYGNKGEALVVEYLMKKGYMILNRNWRCGHWELDIVAEKDGVIVFVEVKTRRRETLPRDTISERQIRTLTQAAEMYLREMTQVKECRFDLVMVNKTGDLSKIEHIESAFR